MIRVAGTSEDPCAMSALISEGLADTLFHVACRSVLTGGTAMGFGSARLIPAVTTFAFGSVPSTSSVRR